MIDVHCHYDYFENPVAYIAEAEKQGDIIIGMTNLPSHFRMGFSHTKGLSHVRLALGFHPLLAAESQKELLSFVTYLDQTSYIGEIGLDFSREGYPSKDIQIQSLRRILSCLKGKKKIVSVHSRRAEKQLLDLLQEYETKNVIFHWYSGPVSLIKDVENAGYYFSINEAMTQSANGRKIIDAISKDRILTETDAPYNDKCDIAKVLGYIGMTEEQVKSNFIRLLNRLK